ncbi:hypothetical protein AVEN_101864-1 [Araneus ventricosus]|uniref:Uncharacterized protein n=1 Tax=Araneus ventricosus TaxID=182803 RepID=A0A4Y2D8B8_ARAVE|nr:hypothetical protein AVEN_101864-1 [Araneus ventricosus]
MKALIAPAEKCVNCKGEHTSFSRNCSAWKQEKEIISTKIKKQISYQEARKLIKSQTPTPGNSYVSVAKKSFSAPSVQKNPDISICSSKPPDSIARASPPVNNFPISSSPSVAPVSEEALASPDFTDFKLVSNKKKLKRDSPTKTNNSIAKAEKISKFYTSSRREVLNTVPTKDNICTHQSALKPFETKKHTSVDIELLPMAVLPPLEQTVLQSRESDADAEMSSSSLSEEDALEYDMSEDLEDSPAVISPPPFSKPEKGDKYKNRTIGSGINMLGKEKVSRTFNKTEVQAYVAAIGAVPQVVSEYNQMIMNSKMYHREAYTRAGKTDNTVVKISAGDDISKFVKI